jgi:Ca2+-binding EF-hand superfamily protein
MIVCNRQSKLSQTQLEELQRATHFDKKELQQWYKGQSSFFLRMSSIIANSTIYYQAS